MRTKFPAGLAAVLMCSNALSQSMIDPTYFYDQCMMQADMRYGRCERSGPYNGPCINMRTQEQQGCQTMLKNMRNGGASDYAPQPNGGRFYPTPIPQRPVYVLPGAR
jgi:hypothetical protein